MPIFECRDYTLKADIYWNDTYQDYSASTDNIVKPESKFEPLDKIPQAEIPDWKDQAKKGTLPKEFKNYTKNDSLSSGLITSEQKEPKTPEPNIIEDRLRAERIRKGLEPTITAHEPKIFKEKYGSQETPRRESITDPKVTTGKPRPTLPKNKSLTEAAGFPGSRTEPSSSRDIEESATKRPKKKKK